MIESELQVKHSIRDLGRGQYQILYYPELATAHKVDIKYNNLTVADSPIVLHAKNPGGCVDNTIKIFCTFYNSLQQLGRNPPPLDWDCIKLEWRSKHHSSSRP